MSVISWLLGYTELALDDANTARFLNLCGRLGLPYRPCRSCGGQEEALTLRFRLADERRLLAACQTHGVEVRVARRGGLPCLIGRYRRRVGLLVGFLLGAMLVFLASHVVWDVRIEVADGEPMPMLREQLAQSGLSVGTWIPTLESDTVESRLLVGTDQVAWVSVNLRGTVAYVQVRRLLRPESAVTHEPSNLVATCDGVIDSVKLISGKVVVEPGELVRRGQLLVSGVRDSSTMGYVVGAAQGEVLARVHETICVQVERVQQQKVYVGRENGQKSLLFFGKNIKLSKNTTTNGQSCDIIKKMDIYTLPSGAVLPVSLESEVVLLYEMRDVVLTDRELTDQAYERLGQSLAAQTKGAMLVSKQVTSELTDTGILLVCRYECIKNIAEPLALSKTDE